jgi:dienelactone hydrolase
MPDRRLPFLFFSLLLSAFSVSSLASAEERVVDLTASDGTKLKATYFSATKLGPGVLLLHQCNRQRKVWDGLAQPLAAAGINVLTLDLRGFGESGGPPADKATPQQAAEAQAKWPRDIDVAFQYLVSQPGVTRDVIGVGGASCGVDNSVQTARRHPQEVKSLMLLSGFTDLNGRNFLRQDKNIPVFFAYADDDEFKPSIMGIQWLYSLTADPSKKLVSYPTGGHGADIFPVHPELPKLIVDWYVTTLITTPGRSPVPKETVAASAQVRVLDEIDQPGGSGKVEQMLTEARQHDPRATLFPEGPVNLMGYERLQSGDIKGAIEIFKLNVAAYPNSPNVYDSLSDAYLADGQKELARADAEKALELLPSDTTDDQQRRDGIKNSAEQKLKQLGHAKQ